VLAFCLALAMPLGTASNISSRMGSAMVPRRLP
jgi:hypothetical protein